VTGEAISFCVESWDQHAGASPMKKRLFGAKLEKEKKLILMARLLVVLLSTTTG
jgi:hypothetical protein